MTNGFPIIPASETEVVSLSGSSFLQQKLTNLPENVKSTQVSGHGKAETFTQSSRRVDEMPSVQGESPLLSSELTPLKGEASGPPPRSVSHLE